MPRKSAVLRWTVLTLIATGIGVASAATALGCITLFTQHICLS